MEGKRFEITLKHIKLKSGVCICLHPLCFKAPIILVKSHGQLIRSNWGQPEGLDGLSICPLVPRINTSM